MTDTYTETKGALVVHLKGELDQHSAVNLRINLDKKIMDGASHLIFDLSELDFMDSSGIGVIMGRYRMVHLLGGEVWAANANDRMKKILVMSGVTKIIQIYEEEHV